MRNLKEYTALLVKSVRLFSWPVGSIYTSIKPTDPHELFGGTWEPIPDTFLWCAGPKHAAGTTGGEETHKLIIDEMPEHSHSISSTDITGGFQVYWSSVNSLFGCFQGDNVTHFPAKTGVEDLAFDYYDRVNFKSTHNHGMTSSGGGAAHNNMPPYRSVYAWQRVK